jgi:hypothetical protein
MKWNSEVFDPTNLIAQLQGLGATTLKLAQFLFSVQEGDIPVCHTRIMRAKRGLPWNEQIGVHPLEDGQLKLTPIRETPQQKHEYLTRSQFYGDLRKVSRRIEKPKPSPKRSKT